MKAKEAELKAKKEEAELELQAMQRRYSREDERKSYYATQLLSGFGNVNKVAEAEGGRYYVFACKEMAPIT
jgi:hypothetical protein